MEIICDYFEQGYEILYNYGNVDITNVEQLANQIEDLVKKGNKVLIAVDDVQSERTAPIFYVMDKLSDYKLKKNVLFLLTGRLPESTAFSNLLQNETFISNHLYTNG